MNDNDTPTPAAISTPGSIDQPVYEATSAPPKAKRSRKKANTGQTTADQPLDFEQSLRRLEAIVAEMETGKLNLDDCLKKFEEGTRLANFCSSRLAETERKVEILMKNAPQGEEWQPFEA